MQALHKRCVNTWTVARGSQQGTLCASRWPSTTGRVSRQVVEPAPVAPWAPGSSPLTHSARRVLAASGAGPTSTDIEVARLTDAIVAAENRLAALFEPGKPMPRAGVVAAARQEVSDMKAQLAALVGGAAGAVTLTSDAALSDDELAEKARQAFLEVERMLGQKTGKSNGRDDATAIAVLEAENERLRVEATALLMRQQQLEELVASVIAKGKAAASNN